MRGVLFDHGPVGQGGAFLSPEAVIETHDSAEVPAAFEALQAAQAAGKWLAGFASYELGYALIDRLKPHLPADRKVPLVQFGVFDHPVDAPLQNAGDVAPIDLKPVWDFAAYQRAFDTVHAHIRAGDIYQANLTFPLQGRWDGDPAALYAALQAAQPVPHGAYVSLGGSVLLSRSPELFFSLDQSGTLAARPMKGTMPRGRTASEDDALRSALRGSEKNRAENLMIVDLLRNDLSRIAQIGTVRVPKLYTVERYATVHQMTSEVTAQIVPGTSLRQIFEALFPCGSVTGAPKISAMEILWALEHGPREAYCGSIGWIAPDGSMQFNVAIRTLLMEPTGTMTLNVGGGVVYDSTAASEYEEALLKARFATQFAASAASAS